MKLDHPSTISLRPSDGRASRMRTSPVLVPWGSWIFRLRDSNRMRRLVLVRSSTGTRRWIHRSCCLSRHHTLDHQHYNPPGGVIPEPTADAVTNQTNTDEDEVPVSNLYRSHIPHVPEWSFGVSHPSGPGSPRAKGDIAGAVSRHKVTPANCVSGCRDGRSSGYCRARTML